ncbi:MAG: OB-fold nucleic acid binding domain-containing protein [Candidatus Nanohaloarchaea archaeon]|nr:OB-fold nucleic acid binding domain-containing protein [Candidatus Nanohaloarchaea archaeon]
MPRNKTEPARPCRIEGINPRKDIKVRITGTVLEKDQDSIRMDDGTGTTEVFVDQDDLEEIQENQKARVLGRVLPTPESFEIQGEFLRPLEEEEFKLYTRAREVVQDL